MTYRITFRRAVIKEMRRIPRSIRKRLWTAINGLRENPFPAEIKNIRGYGDHYRIRMGDYRIVYCVTTEIRVVTIIKVGHRKDVYKLI